MLKVVNGEAPKTRKLILGFDAGCGTCADLAAGVQEKVGDKLEVQNLNDPQLMAWREEALGKDAKWTPTLFEVEGEKVLKVWAGWRMGYALSRKLGPSSTWQVMQALGEVGAVPKVEESTIVEKLPDKAAEAVNGMSRSQFIKGVSGAAMAMTVLSGTSILAFPDTAEAAPSGWDSIRHRKITGPELVRTAREVSLRRDVRNLSGKALSTAAKIKASRPQAVRHKLRNNSIMLVIAYVLPNERTLIYREYKNLPGRKSHSYAKLWQIDGKKVVLVNASEGNYRWQRPPTRTPLASGNVQPLAECPPVSGGTGSRLPDKPRSGDTRCGSGYYYWAKVCCKYDWDCLFGCAAKTSGCGLALRLGKKPSPYALGAVGIVCAYAIRSCQKNGICCVQYQRVRRPCNPEGPAGDAL